MKSLAPPSASSPAVAAAMRGNKSNNTLPEILLRSALWKSGIRGYRKHLKHLPGSPDIVFPRHRLAVFVHGCFWHRCPKCNIPVPKKHGAYWQEKLYRNLERDKRVFSQLAELGWQPVRFWECDIHHSLKWCVSQVYQKIRKPSKIDTVTLSE
jgi:DNA mismatch endonuclease (patch repair protein)